MRSLRAWKLSLRQRWQHLSWQQQSGWLTGWIALSATMVSTALSIAIPAFWQGALVGLWGFSTLAGIVSLVTVQWRHRHDTY
jgi:hypothetical protein